MRILIANRGEIARRIMRTASRLGHTTVAVYADPDRAAPFVGEATVAVRLGPASLSESYLSAERLLAVLAGTGSDALHPGYGFLSENAAFAQAVIDAGATWIGPRPAAMAAMGSKIEARRLAAAAGVPIIPGFDSSQDLDALVAAADRLGYPVLVKAAAGGGGKGIRVVPSAGELPAALAEAAAEAERSFGDRSMIVERYIQRPRHVEVQIVGDQHGNIVHLGTRECSVQRRYQKLVEEAPAPCLSDATRSALQSAAVQLGRSIGYDSTGTVEFVVDDATGDHHFLEMNTRLQVEHTVTEQVTGLDLVELQLEVAAGQPLGLDQDQVVIRGHAFEARINAEDPDQGFAPQIGTVEHLVVPTDVRWDSAIEIGSEVTPHYDPMLAKLIVDGPDRETARRRLAVALDALIVGGLVTNSGLHRWLVDQPAFVAGRLTTRFLDEVDLPPPPPPALLPAALAWIRARRAASDRSSPWSAVGDLRLTPHQPRRLVGLVDLAGVQHEIAVSSDGTDGDGAAALVASVDLRGRTVAVNVGGRTQTFRLPSRSDRWAPTSAAGHGGAQAVVAPFPASVAEVLVEPGQQVGAGDPVVVLEAMKMLHSLKAAGRAVVHEVRVSVGQQVDSRDVLVTFLEPQDPSS